MRRRARGRSPRAPRGGRERDGAKSRRRCRGARAHRARTECGRGHSQTEESKRVGRGRARNGGVHRLHGSGFHARSRFRNRCGRRRPSAAGQARVRLPGAHSHVWQGCILKRFGCGRSLAVRSGATKASRGLPPLSLTAQGGPSYTVRDATRSTCSAERAICAHVVPEGNKTMAMTHPVSDGLDYHERADEDLVATAKSGDNLAMEFLLNKYKNFVRIKAKSYFLIGADREDIIQEGMIGLYKAVRDFKADKLSSFRAFAELCITRQIITAIKTATRQKHIPLNQYISLNKPIYDEDSERTLLDVMPSNKTSDPEDLVINQEVSEDIKARIQENLSDLESQVLLSYLEGKSYQEMARDLNRHVKSIDNALQRVKRKIEKNLAEIELP